MSCSLVVTEEMDEGRTWLQWLLLSTAVLTIVVVCILVVKWLHKVWKGVAGAYLQIIYRIGIVYGQFTSLLEAGERLEGLVERATTAVVNLERRKMECSLGGAEASRLIAAAVGEYSPYGPEATWHSFHSWRKLEEIKSQWHRGCRKRCIPLSENLWSAIMDGGLHSRSGGAACSSDEPPDWRDRDPDFEDRFLEAGHSNCRRFDWTCEPHLAAEGPAAWIS